LKDKKIITLGIESSCDETAIAVLENGCNVLSNIISSQISVHAKYGGVVPELASRHHLNNISYVCKQALDDAGISIEDVDEIGVTAGPGLAGALLIGTAFAKAIAMAANKALVGVHHIQAHALSNLIEHPELKPPFMALVMSGAHTHLFEVLGYNEFKILGCTQDDAVGEAYDKVARTLGLEYPGGPKIDALAKTGNPHAIEFKRVYLEKGSLNFSFSGTKTGVINYLNREEQAGRQVNPADVAASFQEAVVDVLVDKAMSALDMTGYSGLAVAGGVASNSQIRLRLKEACKKRGAAFYIPSPVFCTDNAAMVAVAAYHKAREGRYSTLNLDCFPGLNIESQLYKLEE
jgi:N6-L-threonylcarbamoyladenine synthase